MASRRRAAVSGGVEVLRPVECEVSGAGRGGGDGFQERGGIAEEEGEEGGGGAGGEGRHGD